jgi:hypothetical protein
MSVDLKFDDLGQLFSGGGGAHINGISAQYQLETWHNMYVVCP